MGRIDLPACLVGDSEQIDRLGQGGRTQRMNDLEADWLFVLYN